MSEAKTVAMVKLSLVGKLAAVMGEVDWVPKDGVNQFHKYSYATEAGIVNAVRGSLAKHGVMIVPSVKSTEWVAVQTSAGKNERLCRLVVHYRILDSESADVIELDMLGEGQDSGDKAFYKAMTGATKYALLKLFLIPTGDDPENEDAPKAHAQTPLGVEKLKRAVTKGPEEPPPPTEEHAPNGAEPRQHDGTMSFAFGRDKGTPISKLSEDSLDFYAAAFQRDLADKTKEKWWPKTAQQLSAVQSEMRFRGIS